MSERNVVGLVPWLPWPLCRLPWWTEPVRAERLAALRIGVAAVLLLDILTTYLPWAADFFGSASVGSPVPWVEKYGANPWRWSPVHFIREPWMWRVLLGIWALTALALMVGFQTRIAALLAWFLALSIASVNPWLRNSGDSVLTIILFYLMLSPAGAAWSLDARRRQTPRPIWTPPWPLRLLFVQMCAIYVMNGLSKLTSPDWRDGTALYQVLNSLEWTRWPYSAVPVPLWLTMAMTWTTLGWELGFPIWVMLRPTRVPALALGVCFHLGTGISLMLGPFPFYMMCLYLPLIPWEKLSDRNSFSLPLDQPAEKPMANKES